MYTHQIASSVLGLAPSCHGRFLHQIKKVWLIFIAQTRCELGARNQIRLAAYPMRVHCAAVYVDGRLRIFWLVVKTSKYELKNVNSLQ